MYVLSLLLFFELFNIFKLCFRLFFNSLNFLLLYSYFKTTLVKITKFYSRICFKNIFRKFVYKLYVYEILEVQRKFDYVKLLK